MSIGTAFGLSWVSLAFSLPIAALLMRIIRLSTVQFQYRVKQLCFASLLILLFSFAKQISFTNLYLNALVLVFTYLSYCYLAITVWGIKSKPMRFASIAIMYIPIVLGYLLSTVGFLALMFMVGEHTESAQKIVQLSPDLKCEVRGWGMAASDSGYTVKINSQWQLLPFIQQTVYSVTVNETQQSSSGEGSDCNSAFAAYQRLG